MEFDRQQLIDNINNLIQQKNLKVGDIENAIGISTGYISRLSKEGSKSIPATDVVWKLAHHLGVSTDALISGDFSKGNDNISVLRRFIKKLLVQTEEGALEWEPVTTKYVNAVLKGDEPLFFLVKEGDNNRGVPHMEDGFSEANSTYCYYRNRKIVSKGAPLDAVWMTRDGFKTRISNGRFFYLFPLCVSFDSGTPAGDIEQNYFEMYMLDWTPETGLVGVTALLGGDTPGHWKASQIFATLGNGSELTEDAKELYDAIYQTAYDLKINAGVKSAILNFLGDDIALEEEE